MSALTTKVRRNIMKFKNHCPTCKNKMFDKIHVVGVYTSIKCRRCGTVIQLHPSNWYEIMQGADREYKNKKWWQFWK